MKTIYMPTRIDADLLPAAIASCHAQGVRCVVDISGAGAMAIPAGYTLAEQRGASLSLRTPEGMLVTYRPKRKP